MARLEASNINFENIKKDNNNEEENKSPVVQIIEEKISWGTVDLSSESMRDRAKKAVLDRISAVSSQHDDLVSRCDRWERMWKIGSVEKSKDTVANIGSTDAWNAVEDWTATIMDTVFGIDPMLQIKGRKKVLPPDLKERILSVLCDNAKQTKIEEESEVGIREGIKLGTFSFKTSYQMDETPKLIVKERMKTYKIGSLTIPTLGKEKYIEQGVDIEDRPALRHVDLRKLYFRHDRITWIIEELNENWAQIEKLAEDSNVYGNLEKAKETSYPTGNESDRDTKSDAKTENTSKVETLDGDVMLYEAHHIPFQFKSDDPVPDEYKGKKILCIITLANKSEVIRIQPTPFKEVPYLICPLFKQAGSVLGIGIIEIIQNLIIEYNTRKNMSLDNNLFGLYCMVVANMRYVKKKEQLKIRQNGVVELKDMPAGLGVRDVVDFIRPPTEYSQLAEGIIARIQQEIQRTTRLKGVLSGEKIAPNPSATEMASIAKEALKSVKIILRRIDRNIFEEYFSRAYIMMILNRQKSWVIEMEKEVPVIDPTTNQLLIDPQTNMPKTRKEMMWEEITPEQIYSDGIEIEMLGTSHMQDEVVVQHKLMQAMDLAGKFLSGPVPNEKGQMVTFNKFKAFNDILHALSIENVDGYWLPAPPPPMPVPTMPPGGAGMAPVAPGVGGATMPPNIGALLGGAVNPMGGAR